MDRCTICGRSLVSDACIHPTCIQIEMFVAQVERENALVNA